MTFTATQMLAYASVSAPQNLTVDASDGYVDLEWNSVYSCDHYNVYMSTDGVNYSVYKNTTYADCSVSSLSKGIYYFYVTAVKDADYDYDDEDNYYYIPAQESEPSNIVSATLYTEETYSPMLTYSSSKSKMKIEWSYSSLSAEDCNGFVIYRSKNGGEYQKVTTVSSGKYSKSSSGEYTYKYSQSVSSSPATYKYVVASYAVINGVTYSNPDYSDYSKYYYICPTSLSPQKPTARL
ncbi:MAG: hypothetical protein LUG95_06795 [Clostridiales bacterium]|nr:hypothetical protein [Clostridiales bacterium]